MQWPQMTLPGLLSVLLHIMAGLIFVQGWSAPVSSPPRFVKITLVTQHPPASTAPQLETAELEHALTIAQPSVGERLPPSEQSSGTPFSVAVPKKESTSSPSQPMSQKVIKKSLMRRQLRKPEPNNEHDVPVYPSVPPEPPATGAWDSMVGAPPVTRNATVTSEPTRQASAAATPPAFDATYLNNPAPLYPSAARRLRLEGTVLLRVQVSAEGAPQQIQIEQSSGSSLLDEAAINAVREWSFIPSRLGGEAIAAAVVIPIRFRLN